MSLSQSDSKIVAVIYMCLGFSILLEKKHNPLVDNLYKCCYAGLEYFKDSLDGKTKKLIYNEIDNFNKECTVDYAMGDISTGLGIITDMLDYVHNPEKRKILEDLHRCMKHIHDSELPENGKDEIATRNVKLWSNMN